MVCDLSLEDTPIFAEIPAVLRVGGEVLMCLAMIQAPPQPAQSFRIALELSSGGHRIDAVLLEELRKQDRSSALKNISRTALKKLFKERRIHIKGQSAVPSSALAKGTTFIDILGFDE